MRFPRWTLSFLVVRLAFAESGTLTGRARDSHQTPVASATVFLSKDGEKESLTTRTNADGVYSFTVESGDYVIRIDGGTNTRPVHVAGGKSTKLDLVVAQVPFFDEPKFIVAGVTDNTYRGGHGSDAVLRSSESLAKSAADLGSADTVAAAYERSGRPLEAVRELEQKGETNPSEANLFNWGVELLSHRAPQAAADVFRKGSDKYPASTRMWLGLASSYYLDGLYEEAELAFFKAADILPSDPAPYMFLGKAQVREITQSGGYEERMARFAKLQPDNASANYFYALCLMNTGRNAEAKKLLEKAIQLDPKMAPAYLQIGNIYSSEQKYATATEMYLKAVGEDPDLEEAHYRLSEAYRITGDKQKAQQELATYREVSKKDAEKLERERGEIQQFVIALRETKKAQ